MKTGKFILFLSIAAVVSSCHKAPVCDCFESAGAPSSDNRTPVLPFFSKIEVCDDIKVKLTIGSKEQVIIEGGENLIKNISARVSSDSVLTLRNENNCDWMRSYKKSIITVNITMPAVLNIKNEGVGTILGTDTITTPDFRIQVLSSGDVTLPVHCNSIFAFQFGAANLTLTGTCGTFEDNYFGGTGYLYCGNLSTGYTYLSASTTGDCYVNSYGGLDVIINQMGNVYYSGSPNSIQKTINGSGQLLKNN